MAEINFEAIKKGLEKEVSKLIDDNNEEQYLEGWSDGASFCLLLIAQTMIDSFTEERKVKERVTKNV